MVKRGPSSQESIGWPEKRRTAMKAPSNQNGKEGSQDNSKRAPSDQRDIEQPVASKGRQEGEAEEGAQQSSGGADQSSLESAE